MTSPVTGRGEGWQAQRVRPRPALLAALSLALIALTSATRADDAATPRGQVTLTLEAPARELRANEPFEVVATIRFGPGTRGPFLLTPTSDGPAVEILRGRFSGIDAEPAAEGAREVTLRMPMFASVAGDTVLRAHVDAFACEAGRCRAARAEASRAITVLP